jgi:RNA polymerase sigma factor (TIGR02999 family)
VTLLLRQWRSGDRHALDELAPLIYDELRRRAAAYMRRERPGHTLSPADLVAEAFLRLAEGQQPEWADRAHFFAVAARHMRQLLVDHARRRAADRRGGGQRPVTFDEASVPSDERPEALIALDEALVALGQVDGRKARVVELSYFGGMAQDEIAAVVGVHVNTVARDLRLAEAWLHRHLTREA